MNTSTEPTATSSAPAAPATATLEVPTTTPVTMPAPAETTPPVEIAPSVTISATTTPAPLASPAASAAPVAPVVAPAAGPAFVPIEGFRLLGDLNPPEFRPELGRRLRGYLVDTSELLETRAGAVVPAFVFLVLEATLALDVHRERVEVPRGRPLRVDATRLLRLRAFCNPDQVVEMCLSPWQTRSGEWVYNVEIAPLPTPRADLAKDPRLLQAAAAAAPVG